MKYVFEMQNVSLNVNEECVNAYRKGMKWKCMFSPHVYPFMKVPVFVIDSMYDSWQMENILGARIPSFGECAQHGPVKCNVTEIGRVNIWRNVFISMLKSSANFNNPRNGVFLYSCWNHCASFKDEFWSGFHINGVLLNKAVGDWFFERSNVHHHQYIDCQLKTTPPYRCNGECSPE